MPISLFSTQRIVIAMMHASAILVLASGNAFALEDKPAALRAVEEQGVTVVGPMPSAGGLRAWAAYSGRNPIAFYATPDGKFLIAGTMLDANGRDVHEDALAKTVAPVMATSTLSQLERSHWVLDGSSKAPRIVYVFTDPDCPYCNKFWRDARPWIDSGKVQLRHILLGILSPTSAGKAAAILTDSHPARRLESHERSQMAAHAKTLGSGRSSAQSDSELKPLASIPAAIEAQLASNAQMMQSFGLAGTPGLAWRDANGKIQMRTGAPAALQEILGPK